MFSSPDIRNWDKIVHLYESSWSNFTPPLPRYSLPFNTVQSPSILTLNNFFQSDKILQLREIALKEVAHQVERKVNIEVTKTKLRKIPYGFW